MTTQEFSNEFDILYNNVMSNQAPGLDEYEKSVFLTKAQDEILKNYFNPKGNKYQEGFDGNQKRQYDFSNLIRTASLFNINSVKKDRISNLEKFDRRSVPFVFPQDYFIAVNEVISDSTGNYYSVIPLTYDEYQRYMSKPYAYPTKRAAWRILTDKKNCNYYNEYIVDYEGNPTTVNYEFLSTWADQKRNLKITITSNDVIDSTLIPDSAVIIGDGGKVIDVIEGDVPSEEYSLYVKRISEDTLDFHVVKIKSGWSDDGLSYEIKFNTVSKKVTEKGKLDNVSLEDDEVVKLLKEIVSLYKDKNDSDGQKAYERLDGLLQFSVPSKFSNFFEKEIITSVIPLPIAEVIGKFKGDISYQMRYVKKPKPIILADLGDLSIKGLHTITECELPEEVHSEVLQRAVELAKAAYVGDLKSSVELGQRSE